MTTATSRKLVDPRSEMWISEDPQVYLRQVADFCREQFNDGPARTEQAVAFLVGSKLTSPRVYWREMAPWLLERVREILAAEMTKGHTLSDGMVVVQNLLVRAMEAERALQAERRRNAKVSVV